VTGRAAAVALALLLALLALLAVTTESARGTTPTQAQQSANAIAAVFGRGPLFACMAQVAWRESRLDPRAENLTDHHADGSTGSWGLFEIGSLWRRPGETVDHFRARMMNPAANAREARLLYDRYGLTPWGGSCG
jgi:hypothetical protein